MVHQRKAKFLSSQSHRRGLFLDFDKTAKEDGHIRRISAIIDCYKNPLVAVRMEKLGLIALSSTLRNAIQESLSQTLSNLN